MEIRTKGCVTAKLSHISPKFYLLVKTLLFFVFLIKGLQEQGL